MAWCKEGVVTLKNGSRTVIGSGTSWLGRVLAGEGLDCQDRISEIAEVINNTELLLVDAYSGLDVTSEDYQIIPNASMTKELTRRVNALIGRFESDAEKLDGVADGATKNAADADLLERANHTGTQEIETVSGLQIALNNKADSTSVAQAIAAAETFTAVPTKFQAFVIVVTQPHFRCMVWNGAKYVRAPWHMPGILFHSHAPAASITHGIQVRADVNYNVVDHPDLAEILGFTGGTFVLPEGRARVLRATDSGIGIDTALVNGVLQNDAGRNLTGQLGRMFDGSKNGAFEIVDSEAKIQFAATGGSTSTLFLNASLQWPTASEFRVKSLAATLYITR